MSGKLNQVLIVEQPKRNFVVMEQSGNDFLDNWAHQVVIVGACNVLPVTRNRLNTAGSRRYTHWDWTANRENVEKKIKILFNLSWKENTRFYSYAWNLLFTWSLSWLMFKKKKVSKVSGVWVFRGQRNSRISSACGGRRIKFFSLQLVEEVDRLFLPGDEWCCIYIVRTVGIKKISTKLFRMQEK